MAKTITWCGKTEEEILKLDQQALLPLLTSRQRRTLRRANFSHSHKELLKKVAADDKNIRTHCRDALVMPIMVGKMIKIYNGKEFLPLQVTVEMIGHYLGEFAPTRKQVTHGSAGIGATRSSKGVSAK